ncbi:MAG: hypothetical protein FWC80_05105 [Firmicutes bacterium]|nr:hypothetical protein [Bacillota bacterium]
MSVIVIARRYDEAISYKVFYSWDCFVVPPRNDNNQSIFHRTLTLQI